MKVNDHFLTQESFELRETEIKGIFKTYPIPKDLGKYYDSEDYISHHQDTQSFKEKIYKSLQTLNLKYKKKILLQLIKPSSKILDYGCGAGEFLKYIENTFTTIGFEPNETALNFAQQKLKNSEIIQDLNNIPDYSLDAITLWHVFEHIEEQEKTLDQFYRKLKDQGILIIAVPNCSSFDALHYQENWAAYDVPRHIYHFTKIGMENLLQGNKWNLEKTKPLLLDSFYISMMSEKYKKSRLFWLKGLIFGAISNFKALKTGQYSSLIYNIRKK